MVMNQFLKQHKQSKADSGDGLSTSGGSVELSSFDFSLEPYHNLENLLKEAENLKVAEPTAMSLATVHPSGAPQVRTVLFKGIIREGLSFYTNMESEKGKSLLAHPQGALNFYWAPLQRQVRFEGKVVRLTRDEDEAYFQTRPRLSQIGAWASLQSQELPSFEAFNERVAKFDLQFADQEVPCPPHWGGFHLLPIYCEFWFGRSGRLHERYCFSRASQDEQWRRFLKFP